MSTATPRALAGHENAPVAADLGGHGNEGNHYRPHQGAEGHYNMNTISRQDTAPKVAQAPVEAPEQHHGLRIADLNEPLDPRKLSHIYKVGECDAEVMGGPKAIAFCGFVSKRRATVDGYVEARKPGRRLCPECAVVRNLVARGGEVTRAVHGEVTA